MALVWAAAHPAAAQSPARIPVGSTASGTEALRFNQTQGFAQAEVVTAQGKKHLVFVPLSMRGFDEIVLFSSGRKISSVGGSCCT